MEPHDPEVDGVERDHDRDETGGRDQRPAASAPGAQAVGKQVDGVDDPGDRAPGFFLGPSPPARPSRLARVRSATPPPSDAAGQGMGIRRKTVTATRASIELYSYMFASG